MRELESNHSRRKPPFFYGWYIVGVGFLSYIACAFPLSSTLSIFLKPMAEDLGVSRGVFSLLRSGEILMIGLMAPTVGPLVDRHSGRWLMVLGALAAGGGFLLLSQVTTFWQFLVLRWVFITVGGVFMGQLVINVTVSRWFIRKRGRALAIASMGQGVSKVAIPLLTASLFIWLGWRKTWGVFGILTLLLVVGPAFIFMRRSPEDLGLRPDGAADRSLGEAPAKRQAGPVKIQNESLSSEVMWSRGELLGTQSFWLIVITFSIANIGMAGLNLHVFAYITDIGYSAIVAATVITIIAFTQAVSTLFWGVLSERIDVRKLTFLKFLFQAFGLTIVITTPQLSVIYVGFFLYGFGLGGGQVVQEVIWANYFGRSSLGTVRGLGMLFTHALAAVGPPFFGFLFDATESYRVSFMLFIVILVISACLILFVRRPHK